MLIPTFNVSDMPRALAFYTDILDFRLVQAWPDPEVSYAVLTREGAELHLSGFGGNPFGVSVIMVVSEIDSLCAIYQGRGLQPLCKPSSSVDQSPIDQTWGTREVYIDDPDGNTLILQQR